MLCSQCGSTWRVRATALAMLAGLQLPWKPIPDQQQDWSRRGIGLSDHAALAASLAGRFDYTNTYLHRYPRFDLLDVPDDLRGELEYIICSDVLEHVPPPLEQGVRGLAEVLRPGGAAIISVPITGDDLNREYYPGLTSWEIIEHHHVRWSDASGTVRVDESPEYHGGPGQVLAFRTWSALSMEHELLAAGFRHMVVAPTEPSLGVPLIENSGVFLAIR
jgi:SAM-dependent methyltransferase